MGRRLDQAGVTFISVIFMVLIFGIMMAMTGQSWSRLMKREKEEELMFRGTQIFKAISTWRSPPKYTNLPKDQRLKDLKDLQDPHARSQSTVKFLRGDYSKKDPPSYILIDPISGKEFETIKGPDGGIVGVISPSEAEPIKQANFPDEYKHFEGKKKYKEWLFVPAKLRATLPQAIGSVPPGGIGQPLTSIPGGTGQPTPTSPMK